ncbi:MAG: nucleotidyltransferase domain-containing protein [Bacteroidota bacterium]
METELSKITEPLKMTLRSCSSIYSLFGSTASGTSHALSDVDIAVFLLPGRYEALSLKRTGTFHSVDRTGRRRC